MKCQRCGAPKRHPLDKLCWRCKQAKKCIICRGVGAVNGWCQSCRGLSRDINAAVHADTEYSEDGRIRCYRVADVLR